jgi:hypothetical protein
MPPRTYQETLDALTADTSLSEADRDRLKKQAADKEYGDDSFDLEKYRQAAGVAYDYSKKKTEDTGEQQRETFGKQAEEERAGASQKQEFSQADEARDYAQARGAYKY